MATPRLLRSTPLCWDLAMLHAALCRSRKNRFNARNSPHKRRFALMRTQESASRRYPPASSTEDVTTG